MLRDVKGHAQVISWTGKKNDRQVSNPGIVTATEIHKNIYPYLEQENMYRHNTVFWEGNLSPIKIQVASNSIVHGKLL